jgi:hypothetical protein
MRLNQPLRTDHLDDISQLVILSHYVKSLSVAYCLKVLHRYTTKHGYAE